MKAAPGRALLFLIGILLVGWGLLPRQSMPAVAAPVLLITESPTGEPATRTPEPPTATLPPATATPPPATATPPPATVTPPPATVTPPPATVTPPATPTSPPPPQEEERPRDTPTSTATPTATQTATPTATPTPSLTATPAVLADPAISKAVDPQVGVVGADVTYTIVVSNIGGSVATGVVVEDTLPSFLTILSATADRGEVSVSGNTVRVSIGELAPGESITVRIVARVTQAPRPPNNRNLASVSSNSPDANPNNNQASAALGSPPPASLPGTSSGNDGVLPALAIMLGLMLIAGSLLVRRRARPGARS
ncbi:MAG: DUF11 domain-containing protein [Oscillochloridaceae bacterium]|nr:DUF11 domain-containing protein [Chloroflexaceae bacterium]MDW8389182.1 DUF11 domain-containing protein [Oscillochloridaceae bacterium]